MRNTYFKRVAQQEWRAAFIQAVVWNFENGR